MRSIPVLPTGRRRATRCASALATLCALAASGCDDSVAPAPTTLSDGGGSDFGGGGFQQGGVPNVAPRTTSGTAFGGSAVTPKPSDGHADAGKAGAAGVGQDFYVAAEAVTKGPAGSAVDPDDRAAEVIEKAAAGHPALAPFDRSAAQALPAPDPTVAYVPIVDPAEGEVPGNGSIDLPSDGSTVDGVRFSSPSAGRVVLLNRLSEAGKPDRSRLVRCDLASGDRSSQVDLPDRAVLLDVSPDGTRALVRLTFGLAPDDRPAASQTRLDVWELTEATGRHIAGWEPGAKEDGAPAVPVGAAFLDGDRVMTLTDDGVLVLWSLPEAKAIYTVETGAKGPLVVTPGRKFAALFTGTTFGAFESETGAFRGLLAPPRPTLAGCRDAAFSPDGAQFAAVLRRPAQSLVAWDVGTGRTAHEIDAPLGLGDGLHFGSPGYAVAGGVLFDLAAKKPVWLYVENPNCRNVGASPDRRHWAVTQPAFKEPILQAVDAPTNEIAIAARSAADLAPPRLGPGDKLAVRLKLSDDFSGKRPEFEAALGKALGRVLGERGLRLDAAAGLTLSIDADEQATGERISFTSVGIGADEAVPVHELTLTLAVVDAEDKTLWAEADRVAPSAFLARQEGKSLEAVLVEELWRSAPAAIAARIERSMPAYLRNTPAASVLGQTRLWAGVEDLSPPGEASVAANSSDRAAGPVDPIAAAPALNPVRVVPVANGSVRDIVVAPALGLLLTSSDDKAVRLWEPAASRATDEVRHKTGVTKLALHPNGFQCLFGTEDGQVRIYDINRRGIAGGYEGANGTVTAVAVTIEPTVIAGTQAGRVVRWTEADRKKPIVIADGQAAVTALAAVPYVNRVVAGWADGTAKVVDAGTGQVVLPLEVNAGPIHGIAVSPDTRTAALATESGGVLLVSLESGKKIDQVDEGAVTSVAFRPDGTQFASGNRLGRVIVWDAASKAPSVRLDGSGGQVSTLVFSGDGLRVAAAVAGRRTVPVWDLSTAALSGAASADPTSAHDSPATARYNALNRPSVPRAR